EAGSDAVDDQLGLHPPADAARAANPTRQPAEPTTEGAQVTEVALDEAAGRVHLTAERAGQQLQTAEAVRALAVVPQLPPASLRRSDPLVLMAHRQIVEPIAIVDRVPEQITTAAQVRDQAVCLRRLAVLGGPGLPGQGDDGRSPQAYSLEPLIPVCVPRPQRASGSLLS